MFTGPREAMAPETIFMFCCLHCVLLACGCGMCSRNPVEITPGPVEITPGQYQWCNSILPAAVWV